jgi:hypothetical protein
MDWMIERIKEPSSWAGVALGFVIIAIVTNTGWPMFIGAAAAGGAILLKEKIL